MLEEEVLREFLGGFEASRRSRCSRNDSSSKPRGVTCALCLVPDTPCTTRHAPRALCHVPCVTCQMPCTL